MGKKKIERASRLEMFRETYPVVLAAKCFQARKPRFYSGSLVICWAPWSNLRSQILLCKLASVRAYPVCVKWFSMIIFATLFFTGKADPQCVRFFFFFSFFFVSFFFLRISCYGGTPGFTKLNQHYMIVRLWWNYIVSLGVLGKRQLMVENQMNSRGTPAATETRGLTEIILLPWFRKTTSYFVGPRCAGPNWFQIASKTFFRSLDGSRLLRGREMVLMVLGERVDGNGFPESGGWGGGITISWRCWDSKVM